MSEPEAELEDLKRFMSADPSFQNMEEQRDWK